MAVDVDGDATEFVWDSNQAVPQVLSISDAAGSADQLYGLTRLAELTSAGADPYGFTVLGDIDELGTGFDPFGNPLSTPSSEIGFGYRAELHVGEQIHLRARDLHAGVNRFTAVDPLDGVMGTVVETDPFHYANNDPVNMVDPLGLRPGGGSLRPGDEDTQPNPIPTASNARLQNYIDQLFKHVGRPGTIGSGATMAALPSELAAGGGPHIQKAYEIRRGLRKWLRTSEGHDASDSDRAIAQALYDELDRLLP